MADYANCPTCHGRGLVPLEVAERIETHEVTNRDADREARRQAEREMVEASLARRTADAEKRLAAVNATLWALP